ncbi:MAG: T9SS type A sorting domain-containing protein [Ignavibacteria bacterium]|nr:T9SS type A sorting domain-containing protein [Ignavibacteria bacterium]
MKNHLVTLSLGFLITFLPVTLLSQLQSIAEKSPSVERGIGQALDPVRTGSININNLWLKIRNDGIIGYDSIRGTGLTYPFQYGNLLFSDNLIWVGKVRDGQLPELRTGGGIWQTGVRPGSIVSKGIAEDFNSEGVRVYRYRPDYQTADLTYDVAASSGFEISSVTPAMVAALRKGYEKDEAEWPWQKGAPFVDQNRNGRMDGGEKPGLQGANQIAWFSYNDLDEARCKSFAGGPSIGLEVQVTLWAYKGTPNLEDVIFKRFRVIYEGTTAAAPSSSIDSMYITQWVDPEIGDFTNDLGGCDSTLSLGYVFNSTEPDSVYRNLGGANPALGYTLLQGPLVAGNQNDRGIFDFGIQQSKKNLAMASFLLNPTGDALSESGYNVRSYWYWNVARGVQPFDRNNISVAPWRDPSQQPTKFMYAGDPISKTGWIDGLAKFWGGGYSLAAGYRRIMLSTGPFTMALGDAQEVVLAMIASAAPTGVENVTWLRNRTKYLQGIYPNLGEYVAGFVTSVDGQSSVPGEFSLDQNFPNPFNPSTRIGFTIPDAGHVRLSVYDILGQEIFVLRDGYLSAGRHSVLWDGRNTSGETSPSGVYFSKLTQGNHQEVRKLLLLR